MAQCTVMRMSWAQLKAMEDDLRSTPAMGPHPPPPNDTIYLVTEHLTKADGQGHQFAAVFGPSRSLRNALAATLFTYPRARGLLQRNQSEGFTHLKWKDDNGDEVLIKLEKDHNPAV